MSGENQPVAERRSQSENTIESNVHAVVGFEPGKLPQADILFTRARKRGHCVVHVSTLMSTIGASEVK